MNTILAKVISFLNKANKEPVAMDDRLIEEFGEQCKKIIRKQFTEQREKNFRIRMSNIGRPLCQLQNEAFRAEEEAAPYSMKVSNTFGDLIEALAILVMKSSGVNVQNEQQKVVLDIGGIALEGTLDVEIDDAIYDIKSTSSFSFDRKFGPNGGFKAIADNDDFGYVVQGYLYSEAYEKPFGGWIAINKASGEWNVVEPPDNSEVYRDKALRTAGQNIQRLLASDTFQRIYEDEPEKFRRKATGNRILGHTCSWCKFKNKCWPGLIHSPQLVSEASNPKFVYYTYVNDKKPESKGPTTTELDKGTIPSNPE